MSPKCHFLTAQQCTYRYILKKEKYITVVSFREGSPQSGQSVWHSVSSTMTAFHLRHSFSTDVKRHWHLKKIVWIVSSVLTCPSQTWSYHSSVRLINVPSCIFLIIYKYWLNRAPVWSYCAMKWYNPHPWCQLEMAALCLGCAVLIVTLLLADLSVDVVPSTCFYKQWCCGPTCFRMFECRQSTQVLPLSLWASLKRTPRNNGE